MTTIPTGKGRLSIVIRDIDRRLKRLEPNQAPGMITNVDPTGVIRRPKNLMMGNVGGGSGGNLPRYR